MKRLIWFAVAVAFLFLGNIVNNRLTDYWQDILQQCGFAIILAVSLNIVNGLTGQFAIGHGGFMAVGAYTGSSVTYLALQKFTGAHEPNLAWMILAMVGGGVAAALSGYFVGAPSLRLKGDYLAIVTLGFGEIIRVLLENTHDISPSMDYMGGATGFQNVPNLTKFPLLFATVIIVVLLSKNLKFSSHGLAFMSIREDEIAADAMGVDTTKIKVSAFVLSAFFAGVGGVLFAHAKFFKPDVFGFILSMNYVVMIVLGGTGSISGSILGAVVITMLPVLLKPIKDQVHFGDEYLLVIYALMLVLMMLLRPAGVFGMGEIRLPWKKPPKEEDFHSSPSDIPSVKSVNGLNSDPVTLKIANMTKRFGGLTAVSDVNLELKRGELVGMIGPNGAGKTTVFNLLTGVYEPSEGRMDFDGEPIAGVRETPSTKRLLGLAWDALIVAFGGFIIGTILSTSLLPNVSEASQRTLQVVIQWGVVVGCVVGFLATAKNRRRFLPGFKPYQFAQKGISRTFQNIRLFKELTVLENVQIATYLHKKTNLFDALIGSPRLRNEERENIRRSKELLARFNLLRVANERARNLPYGDQRRLEIVRALATNPKLLLLDEPAAGMNPQEKVELMGLIRQVRDDFGLTVLLIEHDMKLVMGICERIYVLEYGKIIAEGTPLEVRSNPKVIAAYLGEEAEEEPQEGAASALGLSNATPQTTAG